MSSRFLASVSLLLVFCDKPSCIFANKRSHFVFGDKNNSFSVTSFTAMGEPALVVLVGKELPSPSLQWTSTTVLRKEKKIINEKGIK